MVVLGAAAYKLTADNTNLNRGLAQAEQNARDRSKRIAANFAKIGAAGIAAGGAVLFGLSKLVTASSDVNESINAVNVVFQDGARSILDFSRISSRQVGLAAADFNQLSAQTGALFTNFGLANRAAAEETINLTRRAADLASVFNTDVNDALLALQAGIRGETEPLRRFGVDVTDASLELYLLGKGLNQNVSDLTQSEKALLRYELAMEQTSRVAGDFVNTSDSMANSSRILRARIKDAAAMIGQGLLPVVETVLPWIRATVEWFTEWAGRNPALVRALVISAAAVGVLAVGIGGLSLAAAAVIFGWPALVGAFGLLANPVTLAVLAIIGLIAAFVLLYIHFDTLRTWFMELPLWAQIGLGALIAVLGVIAIAIGVWAVKTLAAFVAWQLWVLYYFAVTYARSIASTAVWAAKSLAAFVLWSVRSLATFAVWSAQALATLSVMSLRWIAAQAAWLARQVVWAAAMAATWLIALGPVGLIIAAIAGLIAIGVLLWLNWDWVKEKAKQVWQSDIGKAILLGVGIALVPLGWLVTAGIAIWRNWDWLKGKAGTIWGQIKDVVKNAVNAIIGFINTMISAWNNLGFSVTLPGTIFGVPVPGGGRTIGIETPNIPHIPTLSAGGTDIPAGRSGAGGLSVQVVMDGATILAADDAEYYITDMVDRAVRRGVQLGRA